MRYNLALIVALAAALLCLWPAQAEWQSGQLVQLSGHDLRLDKKLGEGGLSEVWQVQGLTGAQARYALKIYRGADAPTLQDARFAYVELNATPSTKASSVLNMPLAFGPLKRGSGESTGSHAMLLRLAGPPLSDYGHDFQLKPGEQVENMNRLLRLLSFCERVLPGLLFLRQNGLVHGDLKPSNFLLGHSPAGDDNLIERALLGAQIADWESLRPFGQEQHLGSLDYISPNAALTHSAQYEQDLFAFGLTLLHLLTGAEPESLWRSLDANPFAYLNGREVADRELLQSIASHESHRRFLQVVEALLNESAKFLDAYSREEFFPTVRALILGFLQWHDNDRELWFRQNLDGAVSVDSEGGLFKLDLIRLRAFSTFGKRSCEAILSEKIVLRQTRK